MNSASRLPARAIAQRAAAERRRLQRVAVTPEVSRHRSGKMVRPDQNDRIYRPPPRFTRYKLPLSSDQSRIAAWILIVLYLGGLAISRRCARRAISLSTAMPVYMPLKAHLSTTFTIRVPFNTLPFTPCPLFVEFPIAPYSASSVVPDQLRSGVAGDDPGVGRLLFGREFELGGELIFVPCCFASYSSNLISITCKSTCS